MPSDLRVNMREILMDPDMRKRLIVTAAVALQRREGIDTNYETMEEIYDKIHLATVAVEAILYV